MTVPMGLHANLESGLPCCQYQGQYDDPGKYTYRCIHVNSTREYIVTGMTTTVWCNAMASMMGQCSHLQIQLIFNHNQFILLLPTAKLMATPSPLTVIILPYFQQQ